MGNTLFLIFLNDLPTLDISGSIIQYADDTTIIISAETTEKLLLKIKETMYKIGEWFTINGLKLNKEKTNILFFNAVSISVKAPAVCFDDGTVCSPSSCVKLLGFELDPCFTWKEHINTTCKKMTKGIYALKQIRDITSPQNLKEMYYAYVHSILSYGLMLWGNSTEYERVLKLQKRAVRTLVGGKYRETCREHFKTLQILTSVSQYILEILKYVFRHRLLYKIVVCDNKRSVRRKNGTFLEIPKRRLNMFSKLPFVIGPTFYNTLPEEIKTMTRENNFLDSVRRLLLDKTLYSFKEFMTNDYSHLDFGNKSMPLKN